MIGLATPFVLEDLASGSSHRYSVVSTYEADAGAGKLSAESPVGRAVIGARAGDTVTVATPRGERKFKVTGIGG